MPACAVKFCPSYRAIEGLKNDENITFHKLPEFSVVRKMWIKNLSLDEERITENTLICSRHFRDVMFDRTSESCVKLRELAVPEVMEYPSVVSRLYSLMDTGSPIMWNEMDGPCQDPTNHYFILDDDNYDGVDAEYMNHM